MEKTNSHSLNSNPVKSEEKEQNINTLEEELDCLKHIVKLGAYADAARGLGAHHREINICMAFTHSFGQ